MHRSKVINPSAYRSIDRDCDRFQGNRTHLRQPSAPARSSILKKARPTETRSIIVNLAWTGASAWQTAKSIFPHDTTCQFALFDTGECLNRQLRPDLGWNGFVTLRSKMNLMYRTTEAYPPDLELISFHLY